MDCGVFVLGYMMECALGKDLTWTQDHIATFRARLAFQILRREPVSPLLIMNSFNTLQSHQLQHFVQVAPVPGRKHFLSPSPPKPGQSTKASYAQVATGQTSKRAKLASFPVKPASASKLKLPGHNGSEVDQELMDQLMVWKPENSSSPDNKTHEPCELTSHVKHCPMLIRAEIKEHYVLFATGLFQLLSEQLFRST